MNVLRHKTIPFSGSLKTEPPQANFLFSIALAVLSGLMPLCDGGGRNQIVERQRQTAHLEQFIVSGEYDNFLTAAEKSSIYKPARNELIRNLDTGLAEVFAGDYSSGVQKLIRVGGLSEKYYTKSVTRQALSVLTNNLTLPYYGEDFEITFAGNVAALAFATQGMPEDALVEIRRGEHRLSVMSDAYEGRDKYSDDGFTHYLAGMFYEEAGSYDDARISYLHAKEAYGGRFFPMKPSGLERAIGRMASFDDTAISSGVSTRGARSAIICAFTGKGPVKDEVVSQAHFTNDGVDHVVKMSMPAIRQRKGIIRSVRAKVGDRTVPMDLTADYNVIAANTFNDKLPLIFAKTLARVSARYLIVKAAKEGTVKKLTEKHEKAKKKHGDNSSEANAAWWRLKTASLGIDLLANELLEHADTRGSLLIPERAYCGKIDIRPGDHIITLEYLDQSGQVIETETREIVVDEEAENGAVEVFTALY